MMALKTIFFPDIIEIKGQSNTPQGSLCNPLYKNKAKQNNLLTRLKPTAKFHSMMSKPKPDALCHNDPCGYHSQSVKNRFLTI